MEDKLNGASDNVHKQYEKAAKLKQQQQQQQGSEQIKKDRPRTQPPPPSFGQEQSRIAHNQAMKNDAERAIKANEALKRLKQQQLQKGKDDERSK